MSDDERNERENGTAGEEAVSEPEAPVAPAAAVPNSDADDEPAAEPETGVAEPAEELPSPEEPPTEIPAAEPEPSAAAAAGEPDSGAAHEPAVEEAATETPVDEAPAAAEDEGLAADGDGAAAGAPSEVQEPRRKRKRLPRALRRSRPKPKRERPATRKPIVRLRKPESDRGRRQERRGVVVSHAMDKTIVVAVDTIKAHPRYKKVVRRTAKFHAHDERNEANVGDVVRIVETRPLSKTKCWRLAEIIEAAR